MGNGEWMRKSWRISFIEEMSFFIQFHQTNPARDLHRHSSFLI